MDTKEAADFIAITSMDKLSEDNMEQSIAFVKWYMKHPGQSFYHKDSYPWVRKTDDEIWNEVHFRVRRGVLLIETRLEYRRETGRYTEGYS